MLRKPGIACIFAAALVARGAQGVELRSVELLAGASWMTHTFHYNGAQIFEPDGALVRPAGGVQFEFGGPKQPLSVRIGAEYLGKGYRQEFRTTDDHGTAIGTQTETQRADYLSVPLLLRWAPAGVSEVRPYVQVGPSAEFLISSNGVDVFDNCSGTTLAIQGAVGLKVGNLSAGVRYIADISNPYTPPVGATLESVKSHGLLLQFGYDLLNTRGDKSPKPDN